MINAIVTSLDKENLLASPSAADVDLNALLGKRVRYVDSSERSWFGVVKGVEDPFLVIKFDDFPTGLGQGQILDILEDGDSDEPEK